VPANGVPLSPECFQSHEPPTTLRIHVDVCGWPAWLSARDIELD